MLVSTMSQDAMLKEIRLDVGEIRTQAKMFVDHCDKQFRINKRTLAQKRIYGRKQFTTHRHNQWFVVDMIDHKGLHYIATYTLVHGTGPQPGFIQLADLKMQQKPYLIY